MTASFTSIAENPASVSIEINGLVRRFATGAGQVTAVDELDLVVAAGSAIAITGPSGSGKSTLLHIIGGIERADAGTVRVAELELTGLRRRRLSEYRRTVGFVFQRYHLLPALTALDNVIAPVLPYRVGYDRERRARDLLGAVGLGDRAGALPSQLSGGQQQRVAIARALMARPQLLLADEPTGNLDSRTGDEILALLLRLREELGMTMMIATHEQRVAARCDRMIRLVDGRITEDIDLADGVGMRW